MLGNALTVRDAPGRGRTRQLDGNGRVVPGAERHLGEGEAEVLAMSPHELAEVLELDLWL